MAEIEAISLGESASLLALELLDELRVCVLECLLVLESLPTEVDLNFDELIASLHGVRQPARQAFGAASLLHRGAALDERWGDNLSRPKAIFARHSAAVREGGHKVSPTQSAVDAIEGWLRRPPVIDRSQDVVGPRPPCSAITQAAGEPCSNSAVYLGSGSFAAHCYPHATRAERDKYREHQMAVNHAVERARQNRRDLLRGLGADIAAHWLQRRQASRRWLETLALQTNHGA